MRCQLIQTTRIGKENYGERAMLEFLQRLPENYFIYREFKVAFEDRFLGLSEKRPDFVVLSSDTGLVSIETKDWDIVRNHYIWQNQYQVLVKRPSGEVNEITNPMAQADNYFHVLSELLKDEGCDTSVTSLVAFPRLTRSAFLNRVADVRALTQKQSRFLLDFDRTLFKDDLDGSLLTPQSLLIDRVRRNPRWHPSIFEAVEQTKNTLLPSEFRIGDVSQRQEHQKQLKILSEDQQNWVFNLDSQSTHLLDVAGSGKTNALISKAIYLVRMNKATPPSILLTTYSHNLTENIRRLFNQKVSPGERPRYGNAITIQSMPKMLEAIVLKGYGLKNLDEYRAGCATEEAFEKKLREDVELILANDPGAYLRYDYVFVDEVQDCDDFYIGVLDELCRSGRFFFVGDIGQKILNRDYNLRLLRVMPDEVQLPKSFKMYRTPKYIAELATLFMVNNTLVKQEFAQHGYTGNFQFPNTLDHAAELLHTITPVRDTVERVSAVLSAGRVEDDIMVITTEANIPDLASALEALGIPFQIGETSMVDNCITLVDFMNVKGLERPIVIVSGIEDLYDVAGEDSIFDDSDTRADRERRARRIVYVSLTRACEELIVFYRNSGHIFINELLNINQRIQRKRLSNGV